MTRSSSRSILYWLGAAASIGFGYLAIFSVGAPFFFTGVAMLAVGGWRRRPQVIWPTLAGVWAFFLGYALIAPLECTGTSGAVPAGSGAAAVGQTTCSNILGIDYSGGLSYRAPLLPAVIAGLTLGFVAVVGVRWMLIRPRRASDLADRA